MENRLLLTSPDLTIPHHHQVDGNPPERCPRPLYSWDSTQEDQEIPQEDQVDGSSKRSLPERCSSPLNSLNFTQKRHKILHCYQNKKSKRIKNEVKEEAEELHVKSDKLCKEEEFPIKICTDPGDTRDPQRDIKAEEEEEGHMIKKEKSILEIGNDGNYNFKIVEKYLPEEKCVASNNQPESSQGEELYSCSECEKCFPRKHMLIAHHRTHTGEKPFSCLECGKCFSLKSLLNKHKIVHPEVDPFSCSECGMRFRTWPLLAMHQRVHSSENVYRCSECGHGFFKKQNLKKHENLIHRRLKPN
ncbi:uncharacterized protein ACMZJ9_014459 [Mantella aurantiaca]